VKRRIAPACALVGVVGIVGVLAGSVARTGEPGVGIRALRTTIVGRSPSAMAVDTQTGHVFVANVSEPNHPGMVSMLDGTTGALMRTITVGALPSAVTVDGRHGRVYVVNDKSVSILDARSGRVVSMLVTLPGLSAVASDESTGRTFITTGGGVGTTGNVRVFDTARGTLVRTLPLDISFALAIDEHAQRVLIATDKLTRTGYSRGGVTILDSRSGQLLRRVPLNGFVADMLVDGRRGRAFVLGASGGALTADRVSILDTRNGRLLRTIGVGRSAGGMALEERTGHLFIVSNANEGGNVTTLDAWSGRVLRTARLPYAPTGMTVSETSERIFIVHGRDSLVSVLDARTGNLLRSFSVNQDPKAVAVDDHTGRVFVASNDLSNGVESGVWHPTLLHNIVRALANIRRLPRQGMTGSVSMFDIRAVR